MRVNLFNAKNPNGKRVAVTVTVEAPDLVQSNDGEVVYIIGLYTGAPSLAGQKIDPIFINNVTADNVLREIEKALSTLAQQIDWGLLESDTYAPSITEIYPINNDLNVPIDSNVYLRLKDMFPASFIDTSTIKLKVNGIEVTSQVEIKERENQVTVSWVPVKIKQ
jgi:hypothetical protein